MTLRSIKNWNVTLFDNQYYLGRSIIYLKRHEADILDITKEERDEVFEIAKEIRSSLNSLFQPDMFNYASLGNEVNHVHIHLIPRYKSERVIDGVHFKDENWGKNYVPYDKNFKTSENVLFKIRDTIKTEMNK